MTSPDVESQELSRVLDADYVTEDTAVTVAVPTTDQRLDALGQSLMALHAKVDNVTGGLGAVYTRVDFLTKMLSAVQQVAGMMPGMGKKINQAMAAMDQNGGVQNG